MRIVGRALLLGLLFAAPLTARAQDAVPEIRIEFRPADGYSPADGVAPVYEFTVTGLLPGADPLRPLAASTEMLLKPGHTRQVYREFDNLKLEGDVKVDERGFLMYRIVFLKGGVRIATSTSSVRWTPYPDQKTFSMHIPQ